MQSLLTLQITPLEMVFVVGAFVLAGVVKGCLGFGMPLVAMSVLANLIDVRLAAGLMILPIVASNLIVGMEGGQFLALLRRFWLVIVALGLGIATGSRALVGMDQNRVLAILGVAVVIFAISEQFKQRWRPTIPEGLTKPFGIVAGLTGGLLGGLSTVFGPPIIVYLTALRLPKDAFVRAASVLAFFASVFLLVAFAGTRLLTGSIAVLSAVAIIPVFVGLYVGGVLRKRVNQGSFERIAAVGLLVLGINLLRRSLLL